MPNFCFGQKGVLPEKEFLRQSQLTLSGQRYSPFVRKPDRLLLIAVVLVALGTGAVLALGGGASSPKASGGKISNKQPVFAPKKSNVIPTSAMSTCLQKQRVMFSPGAVASFAQARGVTRAQYQAAYVKCVESYFAATSAPAPVHGLACTSSGHTPVTPQCRKSLQQGKAPKIGVAGAGSKK